MILFKNVNKELYSNRKNVIDGINELSSNNDLDFDKLNVVGESRTWLTGYLNIRFFEDDKQITKVKKNRFKKVKIQN